MNTNLFDNAYPFTRLFHSQADTLEEAVKLLESTLNDFTLIADKCAQIGTLLSKGDSYYREIERELSLTFIDPLDRQDIRELNRALQRTFQGVGAVSSRLGLYGFREIQKGAGAQATCLAEMANELAPLLEVVVRKGTGAANRERVRKLKKEADSFILVGLGELYDSAGGGAENLLEVLKWNQIYDRLEEVASCMEHTVNIIEGIILKKV
ncbi:MAG: DUF47 family protein [Verrucomicrobia bacterium]|nr:DUF47 family protein [Verrucomicrobiota bacterium]